MMTHTTVLRVHQERATSIRTCCFREEGNDQVGTGTTVYLEGFNVRGRWIFAGRTCLLQRG